jgi:hypothetical protein
MLVCGSMFGTVPEREQSRLAAAQKHPGPRGVFSPALNPGCCQPATARAPANHPHLLRRRNERRSDDSRDFVVRDFGVPCQTPARVAGGRMRGGMEVEGHGSS